MASRRRKTEEGRTEQRQYAKNRYENLSQEEKQRKIMMNSRQYYLRKGVIPYPTTSLGKWCIEKGYDIAKVMSGEQPI